MSNYTATGVPEDATKYIPEDIRDEFTLIESAIASKADSAGTTSVSTTSLTIGAATHAFTMETSKGFIPGMTIYLADATDPGTNRMWGLLTAYNTTTGLSQAIVSGSDYRGSGTFASWVIGAANESGVSLVSNSFTGYQNFARATVASHATTADIWTALGNQIDWTGTATTTAFPTATQAGSERVLICAGACSFTAGANLIIDGVASGNTITLAANDTVTVLAITTTQFKLTIDKYKTSNGGSTSTSSAADVILTNVSRLQVISMTAAGKKATLPDATTISMDANVIVIKNDGLYLFAVRDSTGVYLCSIPPGEIVALHCSDNTTAAGAWEISGNVQLIHGANTAEVINAVDSRYISVAMMSATKAICCFKNVSTTYLNAVILNYGTASGTPVAVNAEQSDYISVCSTTSTEAVVLYKTSTGVTKAYVLTNASGTSITVSAVSPVDATAGGDSTAITAISTIQCLAVYKVAATSTTRERILDIVASAVSATSAEAVAEATAATSGDCVKVATISTSKAIVMSGANVRLQSITGSVPAATGSLLAIEAVSGGTFGQTGLVALSTTLALAAYVGNWANNAKGSLSLVLLDISSTTPVALFSKTIFVGMANTNSTGRVSLSKLDANNAVLTYTGGESFGVESFKIKITGDNQMVVSAPPTPHEVTVTSTTGYVDACALDSTHVMAVCRNASNYLSARTLEISA